MRLTRAPHRARAPSPPDGRPAASGRAEETSLLPESRVKELLESSFEAVPTRSAVECVPALVEAAIRRAIGESAEAAAQLCESFAAQSVSDEEREACGRCADALRQRDFSAGK